MLICSFALLLALALAPSSASAAKAFVPTPFSPIDGSGTGATFHFLSGIAVDEANGNLFANDGAVEEVTHVLGAEGGVPAGVASPYRIEGPFAFFTVFGAPNGVAVDNSATSPSKGAAYVVDVFNNQVKKFIRNPLSEKYEAAGELIPTSGPPLGLPLGVGVDSQGNVYVADLESQSLIEFSPTGTQLARIGTAASVGTPSSVAFDGSGDLFVQGFEGAVYEYPANGSGEIEEANFTQVVDAGATGVAVDPATNTLYVAFGDHVNRYDATTLAELGRFGAGVLSSSPLNFGQRIAVNSKTGHVYVSDAGENHIAVFALLPIPDVATGEPTAIGTEAATFNGTVNPSGVPLTECLFEYGATETYDHTEPCAESPASIGEGESPVAVHAEISGLTPGATYHFRLTAKNANGVVKGFDRSFRTAGPPEIKDQSVRPHDTTARFAAQIYPGRQDTEYHFEYVDQASFDAEEFDGAISVPIPAGSISAGTKDVEVAHSIGGLIPSSTYHFRVIATNPSGSDVGADRTFVTYGSQQAFEPCPANEAFRANQPSAALPDCRAYEQATPVNKNGGYLQGHSSSLKASVNGDAVNFESAIGIPGGEGAQEFPTYLASRGAGNWTTQGLLPPASAGQGAKVLGWTPDFSQVFDEAFKPGVGNALLSRSSSDGSLATIVPYTAPSPTYNFAGSSADGSKALFTIRVDGGELSEGGATDKFNLYSWDRDSGQLSLAGILPDGTTPPGGSAAGQGPLGDAVYTQDMHAVAADGSVYFTAGDQLYLRQHPTEPETTQKDGDGNCIPDPVLACTIHVSTSQRTVADPAGPLSPTFQTATPNGSYAFFTSSEELTDDAHTAPPANLISSANIGGGGVEPLLVPNANAAAVAVDGSHIYWADPETDAIGRADLDGSNSNPSFITGADNPQGVAVDGSHVYWTNAADGTAGNGSIGRAELAGTGVNQSFITGATNPRGIDVDANYVYWANTRIDNEIDSSIGRAELAGTGVNQIFIGSNCGNNATDVAVDASHIYIARGRGGAICRANLAGTSTNFLPDFGATDIAVDANHLYWTGVKSDGGAGTPISLGIVRADLDATNAEPNFISAQFPQGVAVDGSHIYWGIHFSGGSRGTDLYRFDAATGALTDLMPDPGSLLGADVRGVLGASSDGSYVYFAANGVPSGVENSPNAEGETAEPGSCQGPSPDEETGTCNLYLAHAGTITFIARLEVDGGSNSDVTNWMFNPGAFGPIYALQKNSRVTPDGRTLLFRSKRQLTAYDNEGTPEFYRYKVGDPGPICVSCNPTGAAPVDVARLGSITHPTVGTQTPAYTLSRNLSADGNRVFFETSDSLLAADTNGDERCLPWGHYNQTFINACQDVYEWEAAGTGSCNSEAQNGGCLYLLSTGKNTVDASFFIDASASGDDAFIITSSQLVRQDRDELLDVYDASVGGGLASQNVIQPVPCEGEACKEGSSTPPASKSAGSERFTAPGNPKAVHKKAKKRKRRHQAKRHRRKSHHKRQSRNANTTGRASR